jgi:hypothetical protein
MVIGDHRQAVQRIFGNPRMFRVGDLEWKGGTLVTVCPMEVFERLRPLPGRERGSR